MNNVSFPSWLKQGNIGMTSINATFTKNNFFFFNNQPQDKFTSDNDINSLVAKLLCHIYSKKQNCNTG